MGLSTISFFFFQQFVSSYAAENRTGLYGRHYDRDRARYYNAHSRGGSRVPPGYYRNAGDVDPSQLYGERQTYQSGSEYER